MKPILAAAAAVCLALPAQGAVVWSFAESEAGVTGTLSGSLPRDVYFPLTELPFALGDTGMAPELGTLISIPGNEAPLDVYLYELAVAPAFGPGGFTQGTSAGGDPFALVAADIDDELPFALIGVPQGYAGEALSGTLFFAGASFDSLGVTQGELTFGLFDATPGELAPMALRSGKTTTSLTLRFEDSPAPIPLPAAGWVLLSGLAMLGGMGALRRRRG